MVVVKTVQANKFTCGGCGRVVIVETNEPDPKGYHGSVVLQPNDIGVDFFACRESCIKKAIITALEPEQ